jgi:hypothetical protein
MPRVVIPVGSRGGGCVRLIVGSVGVALALAILAYMFPAIFSADAPCLGYAVLGIGVVSVVLWAWSAD